MSELISGKEAKLAWANGEDIQLCYKQHEEENTWFLLLSTDPLSTFDRDDFLFRLKPHTILINGIEVPAPFDSKDGDEFWILFESHYSPCGYKLVLPDNQYSELCYGAWRTEDEIKQVVSALRFVFKGGVI